MAFFKRRDMLLASLAGLLAETAAAQALPTTARIVVGFTPGSGPDLVARQMAQALGGKLAEVVMVDNRTGASGNLAVGVALALPADGSTLLSNPSGVLTINPFTFRKPGFSPFDDLAPISLISRYELGFAVGPAVPASVRTLADFAGWARQQRQPVAYGSPAAGSALHFMAHAYGRSQGLDMIHAPYRGASAMVVDIMGGQIAAGAASLPALMAHAADGRLRVLASTGPTRSKYFPAVPTFEEQGVRGLDMREWHGIYVAGKPKAGVVERLVPLVRAAVASPDYVAAMARQGFEPVSCSPKELDALARADAARWGEIVKSSGFVQES